MIRSLTIDNFRAFHHFSMEGLGRINLCVGTNNCGKTSVLEAVNILAARGRPEALFQVLARRGERWIDDEAPRGTRIEADICHLFYGHELETNASFQVTATNDHQHYGLVAKLVETDAEIDGPETAERVSRRQVALFDPETAESALPGRLTLELTWNAPRPITQRLPMSRRGGISTEALERYPRKRDEDTAPTRFITTEALVRDEIVSMYETIVLTPEESGIIEALQTIEPEIERIAPIGSERRRYFQVDRGGIVVKLRGSKQRIPIGSMGDGIWRMLGIALSLSRARGGILLVDEIDTGLHYSVMESMWRLVCSTARRLDVQVFATTHSHDCVRSLSAISRSDVTDGSEVSIQRIERGNPRSVQFTEQEIVIAAERSIEVR